MKKNVLLVLSFFISTLLSAQLLTTSPAFPVDGNGVPLTITVDATKGNLGLQGFAGPVYVHIGIITTANPQPSPWSNVQTTWGTAGALSSNQCTNAGTNRWSFTINNIRTFFQLDASPSTRILKIAILFRDAAGNRVQRNADGSDMYISVAQPGVLNGRITAPPTQPTFVPQPEPVGYTQGTNIPVSATTSANATSIILRLNGTQIASASNTNVINANVNSSCQQQLTLEATDGTTTVRDTVNFLIYPSTYPTAARPAGRREGITYENNGTEAVMILFAPQKSRVAIVGDFNNWQPGCSDIMAKDGDFYWVRITGLTPGSRVKYQYVVDDAIRVADPYTELILDPWNDSFIPSATFPGLPSYPSGKTNGLVGVLTPGEAPFNWTDGGYVRPNKYNLTMYELHMRDFTDAKNWQTLRDTLPYLIRLGFNAIKLMPFNEFDGNNSWGYNPAYFLALDKAYGTKQALKEFINTAHNNGIAVIMDAVLNHATGASAMAAMWWNSALNRPAANSPYFYETAQHDFNVFNDFNHNVAPTRNLTERFIEYWLTEYKIDGFRWDLSKGFTTNNTLGNIGAWNAFNQGRIDIWQNYYNKMQSVSAGSYCILEHLSNDDEEAELAKRGMLLWGKMTDQFNENTMGFSTGTADVNRAYWPNRPFWNDAFLNDKPGLIAYAESHDEERIMYKNLNVSGSAGFGNTTLSLQRTEPMAAFLMAIPGPKMIWQFGELGYDFSINRCENGTINADCRTAPKPIRWDYFLPFNSGRRRLYEVYSSMNRLRRQFPNAFNRNTVTTGTSFGSNLWKTLVLNHTSLQVVVVANFNTFQNTATVTFPSNGTWYDYLTPGNLTINVAGGSQSITLPAGGYKVYTNQLVPGGTVTDTRDVIATNSDFKLKVYPNPVQQQATLTYELPKSGQVSIQLINLQGQVVATKAMGFQLKGPQVFEINRQNFGLSTLTPGQYVLQVRVDNTVRYEKIMMQQF